MKLIHLDWLQRTSWSIPLSYICGAIAAGIILPRLEHQLLPHSVSLVSTANAATIASSIASGMISLTGIVFSITFVIVQFSATAYSPRLVLWVARLPIISHALGIFTATFIYSLLFLIWVDRNGSGTVPFASSAMCLVLLLASMGVFIALIDHVGLLGLNRMLVFTAQQGREVISELYSSPPSKPKQRDYKQLPVTQSLVHSGSPQVLQAVNTAALLGLAEKADAVIEVVAAFGDTLVTLTPVLRVRGAACRLDERQLTRALEMGPDRTFEQDPKYALRLLVDIAIKALSPAVNDPTTAVQALDQIEDLLVRLGQCDLDIDLLADREGKLRVVIPFPKWEDFVRLALDEICFYGAGSVQVMRRVKALTQHLTAVLPAERHPAMKVWEQRLHGTVSRSFADADQKHEATIADRQGLGIDQSRDEDPVAAAHDSQTRSGE